MSIADNRSIPDLLENALRQASDLVRDEIALARAEIAEKAAMMGKGAAMIVAGALLLLPALVMILLAVAALLINAGIAPWLANLITGVGALVIGGVVARMGANQFSADRLAPRETMQEIQRDSAAVREMAR